MSRLNPFHRDLAVAAVVATLALSEAAQVYIGLSLLGGRPTWGLAMRSTAPSWAVLLVLTVPLLRLLDRYGGPMTPRRVVMLGLGAVVFTALHLAGSAFLGERLAAAPMGFRAHFYQLATVYFVTGVLTFLAVVALHDALRRYRDQRYREVAAARRVADVAEARFHALRGQLRPDFFFNTLNAVAGLVVRGDASRSVDALSSLSALLRVSLSLEPGQAVPLDDEMELVSGYLSIQKLRFPDRLQVGEDTPARAGRCAVPALVLVQLVEAVVDRGLEAGGPFSVWVSAGTADARLNVTVTHSAPPLAPSLLEALAERLRGFDPRGRLAVEAHSLTLSMGERRLNGVRSDPWRSREVVP